MNCKSIIIGSVLGFQCLVNGGDLYVAGYGYSSGLIIWFDTAEQFPFPHLFDGGLASAKGLAFDGAGNLYVGDYDASTIYRYSPNGDRTTFATVGLHQPTGLAIDGDGNVYAANLWGNNVTKYTPDGSESVFVNVAQPTGLTFDSTGNLYVCTGNSTIMRYDPLGHGELFATYSDGLGDPISMQFDPAGNLFVANYGASDIVKRDTSGNWSVFATTPNNAFGLALDTDGSLFVSCNGGFIQKYDALGNGTYFTRSMSGPWMMAFKPVPEPAIHTLAGLGALSLLAFYRNSRDRPRSRRGTRSDTGGSGYASIYHAQRS